MRISLCFILIFPFIASEIADENNLHKRQIWILNIFDQIAFQAKFQDVTSVKFPITDANDIEISLTPENLTNFQHFNSARTNGKFNNIFVVIETILKIEKEHKMRSGLLERFHEAYERGFLDKEGVYSFLSETNFRDTNIIFDVLYFAKDWETFVKIAEWGKRELHPVQFALAFYTAVFNRNDCEGLNLPPLYEVFPNYFVPNQIIKQAFSAYSQGKLKWRFPINNTGYEKKSNSDVYKSDDLNFKISYFREDIQLGNWFCHCHFLISPFMSKKNYPQYKFPRRGETLQYFSHFLLSRYNMERYANWMAPESAIETNKPLIGHNSQLNDLNGFGFLERIDGLIPLEYNYNLARAFEQINLKFKESLQFNVLNMPGTDKQIELNGIEGLNLLEEVLYSSMDSIKPFFKQQIGYLGIAMIDGMTRVTNDRHYISTSVANKITVTKDPVLYKLLTNIREIENIYLNTLPPYTRQELEFPGVEIKEIAFSHMETYFERYNFSIANLIPLHNKQKKPDLTASQVRLNHQPFTYEIKLKSDKKVEAYVKVFLGPLNDNDYRPLTLNQARRAFYILETFKASLGVGDNVLKRNSLANKLYQDYELWDNMKSKAENSSNPIKTDNKFCTFPNNLMIPRGWPVGARYNILITVTEFNYSNDKLGQHPCNHQYIFDQHSVMFPLDRRINENSFKVKNIKTTEIEVFHTTEQIELR